VSHGPHTAAFVVYQIEKWGDFGRPCDWARSSIKEACTPNAGTSGSAFISNPKSVESALLYVAARSKIANAGRVSEELGAGFANRLLIKC
jgi:hypothetical protein